MRLNLSSDLPQDLPTQWFQKTIALRPKPRGFHLVSQEIIEQVPELCQIQVGIAHIFIRHTSASLTLNENADPDVPRDMERHFNVMVPENAAYFRHTCEGPDDMPAHLKASLLGAALSLPISAGNFSLGTWQGIYLCEHRNHGGSRKLTLTLFGQG